MIELKEVDRGERIQLLLILSRGAKSRRNILKTLLFKPKNCNQIAEELELDWWTVQKHLQFLMSENLIKSLDFGRRKLYKLTPKGREALKTL